MKHVLASWANLYSLIYKKKKKEKYPLWSTKIFVSLLFNITEWLNSVMVDRKPSER